MKLSDKLQDFLVNGPNMWGPQYETIQEAYRLARRVEEAPVGTVGHDDVHCTWHEVAHLDGKRVRIVEE